MKKIFEGVGVAIVTPFINGKVDFDSLGRLIDKCIRGGADAIIALGTTGEGSTIDLSERRKIIQYCKEKICRRAKLIIGTGNNNFKTALKYTKMAKDLGADGALVVTPYYNKTTQDGLIKYYELLSNLEFPIIMYNVPSRTGMNIELDTINKIINSNPYVFGIKESTSDIGRIMNLHKICKDKIAIYSGEDNLNHIFYYLGSSGCISVTANILTREVKDIYRFSTLHDNYHANELQNSIQNINEALFIETNPIPIKNLLHKKNIIKSPEVRLPLITMSNKNQEIIDSISTNLDLLTN